MAVEDLSPNKGMGRGFLWRTGNQTFLSQWEEWPAGSFSTHFKLHSTLRLETKASAPSLNGLLGGDAGGVFTAVWRFKTVSAIICFVVV